MSNGTDPNAIRVAVVDADEAPYAAFDGITTARGQSIQLVGFLRPEEDLPGQLQRHQPDVCVLDGDDPNVKAIEWTGKITVANLPVACVLLWGKEDIGQTRSAMRAGAEDFLVRPITEDQFAAACEEVLDIVRERFPLGWGEAGPTDANYCQVTGFVCAKSGVGKTTLATNIATLFASDKSKRTAIVDLQPGYASVLLNLKPPRGLSELVDFGDQLDAAALAAAKTEHDSGVCLYSWAMLPDFRQADNIPAPFLQLVLQTLAADYDQICVILPRLAGESALESLKILDDLVVVTTGADLLTLRDTKIFLDTVEDGYVDKDKVRIILNRHGKTSSFSKDDVERTIQRAVAATVDSDHEVISASVNMGIPFVKLKPSSALTQSVRNVVTVLDGGESAPEEPSRGFNLFGRR